MKYWKRSSYHVCGKYYDVFAEFEESEFNKILPLSSSW